MSVLILSFFVSPLQLGLYYGINRIYRAFNTLYGPLSEAFYPRLNFLFIEKAFAAKKLIKNFFIIIFLIGALFFGFIQFFTEQIIIILIGESFLPAVGLLKLFSLILPLTAISNVIGRQWLMVIKKDFFML